MKQKIDHFLWAFIWMLPVIAFIITYAGTGGSAPAILSFIDGQFSFPFVKDILNEVWQLAFNCTMPMAGLISYLVGIEVAHCMFDIIVFIPRFAHDLIEKGEKIACGRK